MRKTIKIDPALLREAEQVATLTGKSVTAVIEDALREWLARQLERGAHKPVSLITVDGNGLLPGVDLDHTASLLDAMDEPDQPS